MSGRRLLWTLLAALALALPAVAGAGPLSPAHAPKAASAVVKAHGCHYECRFSQELGWHNHSNAECRVERCRGDDPAPRGGYGDRGGGHTCHYDCQFSPSLGWHNHSNAECRVERCAAPGGRPSFGGRGGHGGGDPCHYDCQFTPELGWHNHSNAECRVERCRR
ncbi:MAG: hypothetical protein AB7O57_22290 [Hyphomicrobiaceae bacterium]